MTEKTHATVIHTTSGKTYVVQHSLETVMEMLGAKRFERHQYASTPWRDYSTLPAAEFLDGNWGNVADTFFNLDNVETVRRAG